MKEKIIGFILLTLAVLLFADNLSPLDLGAYHLRPYLLPAALLIIGWLLVHGPGPLTKKIHHHSHLAGFGALGVILFLLWRLLHRHH